MELNKKVDQILKELKSGKFNKVVLDSEKLLKKLEPLENSLIWKSSALELKAFIYLKNDNTKKALETFESITQMPNKPSSLGLRAKNMYDFLEKK